MSWRFYASEVANLWSFRQQLNGYFSFLSSLLMFPLRRSQSQRRPFLGSEGGGTLTHISIQILLHRIFGFTLYFQHFMPILQMRSGLFRERVSQCSHVRANAHVLVPNLLTSEGIYQEPFNSVIYIISQLNKAETWCGLVIYTRPLIL